MSHKRTQLREVCRGEEMIVTDRATPNCKTDYCLEWDDGTWYWIKDNKVVDANDSLDEYQVNELLIHIVKPLEEYKWMYEELNK